MNTETFLVDTGIWISSFCSSNQASCLAARKILRKLEKEENVATCGIVLTEFVRGLGETKKESEILEILGKHECLEMFMEIFIYAGQLAANLDKKGLRIPLTDCFIAATAMIYGATLVTNDPHFKRFEKLKLKFVK